MSTRSSRGRHVRPRANPRGSSDVGASTPGVLPGPAGHACDAPARALSTQIFVFNEDRSLLLSLPREACESTDGLSQYDAQPPEEALTHFRFQLCRRFNTPAGCKQKERCEYIHSTYPLLSDELKARVAFIPAHKNTPVAAGQPCLYEVHACEGAIHVSEPRSNARVRLAATECYITAGSLYGLQHPQITCQECIHFARGTCARGAQCNFVHRVPLSGASFPHSPRRRRGKGVNAPPPTAEPPRRGLQPTSSLMSHSSSTGTSPSSPTLVHTSSAPHAEQPHQQQQMMWVPSPMQIPPSPVLLASHFALPHGALPFLVTPQQYQQFNTALRGPMDPMGGVPMGSYFVMPQGQ